MLELSSEGCATTTLVSSSATAENRSNGPSVTRSRTSPSAPVSADLRAGACLLCRNELKRQRFTVLREDRLAAAEQDGRDREEQLVDEISSEQRADHRGATVDVNVSPGPFTAVRHPSQQVRAADDRRRLPRDIGVGERVGHDVFLGAVDPV